MAALPPGSDVVDWLYHNVEGFTDRREARKYASNLLKAGFIRHTVNKITFSEQCYYIFGDLCGSMCLPISLPCLLGGNGVVPRDVAANTRERRGGDSRAGVPAQGLSILWRKLSPVQFLHLPASLWNDWHFLSVCSVPGTRLTIFFF